MHGWGQSSDCFKEIADYLSSFCTITLVDFCGFGKSGVPDKPMSVSDYSRQIVDIIKEYNMRDVIVIAHSFGGRVALEACYKYPHYFSKLVLVDIAGIKPRRHIDYYCKVLIYKFKKKLKLNTEKYGSADYKRLDEVMKQTFVNVVNYDQTYQLKSIKTDTLIVWGRCDKETPMYMAKRLHKKLANSKLVVFEDAGHFCFLDDLYNFMLLVKEFINE